MTAQSTDSAQALASLVNGEWGLGPAHASPVAVSTGSGWHPYDTSGADDQYQVDSATATSPLVIVVFRSRDRRQVAILTPDPRFAARELFERLWRDMASIPPDGGGG